MAAIVTIRDWIVTTIEALTPESMPGYGFHQSGTDETAERLDAMPPTEQFMRSFRVLSDRNFGSLDSYMPLEREGSVTIAIGYTGFQSDRDLEDWIDQDEELIARNLLQLDPGGRPAALYNLDYIGSQPPQDVSGGNGDAVVVRHTYSIHLKCASV